jgi:glycosyltransferase involved in cell wall biosynthesis
MPKTPSSSRVALSVVIPCYNQGEYLLDAISSVEQYQEPVYEIIIVNDGSTDPATQEIFKDLQEKGYHIINQNNLGLSQARNNGIKVAKGKYILTLDADNKIRSNYISKGIEILDEHPSIGVVYGRLEWFGEESGICEILDFDIDKLLLANYIDACAVFRKQLWQDCGGYDPEMLLGYEDWDFWLSAVSKGWKFYHIPEVTFDYRVRSGSMISKCNLPENRKALFYYICTKHINLYKDRIADVVAEKEFAFLTEHLKWRDYYFKLQKLHIEFEQFRNEVASKSHSEAGLLQSQLQQTQIELQILQETIHAMETSKFWKLRKAWFHLKKLIGY